MITCVQLTARSVDELAEDLMSFGQLIKRSGEAQILAVALEHDLSISQMRALFVLYDCEEELAVHELAKRLALSMATTGRAVSGLTRIGMAVRREDEQDRRVKRISISDHGRGFVRGLTEAHRSAMRECAELLTGQERTDLANALAPVLERLGADTTKNGC